MCGRTPTSAGRVVVLAAAEHSAFLLLYPGFPDGNVQVLPGHEAPSREAVNWLAGVQVLPAKVDADGKVEVVLPHGTRGPGIALIDAVKDQQGVENDMLLREINSRVEGTPKAVVDAQLNILRILETRSASLPAEIEQAKVRLWGKPKGDTIA
jgi:hypothetical protein